eukprot:2700765-Prymnesium_polylepis.1
MPRRNCTERAPTSNRNRCPWAAHSSGSARRRGRWRCELAVRCKAVQLCACAPWCSQRPG